MQSKPGSRLSQTPSASIVNPKLKSKLEALQSKYSEFLTNCTTLIQEDPKPSSTLYSKILTKRESHNEFFRESEKLRRENLFLTKVVTELSQKVSVLQSQQSESLVTKKFESQLEQKKKHLERQEQDMLHLQSELEKTRIELNSIKKQHNEIKVQRSRTPALQNSVAKSLLKLPKPKDYSPINRNRFGSPVSRSISPKERTNHQKKVEITKLQLELQKTTEERNLYKSWKDYCSSHPPVPPGVSSIISHYEIELRRVKAINSIMKSKSSAIEKILKESINEIERIQKVKRLRGFDEFIQDLKYKVRNIETEKTLELDNEIINFSGNEVLRLSSARMEKENKDLEEILRRENLIAEIYNGQVKNRAGKVDEFRNTFSTLYSCEKSTGKNLEGQSENFSVMSTPFEKNHSFELSFAPSQGMQTPKEVFALKAKELESVFEFIETALVNKFDDLNRVSDKLESFKEVYQKKIEDLKRKLRNKEKKITEIGLNSSSLSLLREDDNEKLQSYKQALNDKEKYIEGLKELIKSEKDENFIRIIKNEELFNENIELKRNLQSSQSTLNYYKENILQLEIKEIEMEGKMDEIQKIKEKNEDLIENLKLNAENRQKILEETRLQHQRDIENYKLEEMNYRESMEVYAKQIEELSLVKESYLEIEKELEKGKKDLSDSEAYCEILKIEIEKLKGEVGLLETEKKQLETMKNVLDEYRVKFNMQESEKVNAESLLIEYNSKEKSWDTEKTAYEFQIKELAQYKLREKQFESERVQYKIVEKQLQDYLKQIELLDLEIANNKRLEKDLEELKTELDSEKAQKNSLLTELQGLKHTIEIFSKNSEKVKEIEILQNTILEQIKKLEKNNGEIQLLKESFSKAEQLHIAQVSNLESMIKDHENKALEKINENSELLKIQATLEEEMHNSMLKDDKISNLQLLLEARVEENTGFKLERNLLNEDIQKKAKEFKLLEEKTELEIEKLTSYLKEKEKIANEVNQKISDLESKLLAKIRKCKEYKIKFCDLEKENYKAAIPDLNELISQLNSRLSLLEQNNSELQAELESKNSETFSVSTQLKTLESEKLLFSSQLYMLKQHFESFLGFFAEQTISKLLDLAQKILIINSKLRSKTFRKPKSKSKNSNSFSTHSFSLSINSESTLSDLPSHFTHLFNLPFSEESFNTLNNTISEISSSKLTELSEKNYLLEAAYKKLAEEIISYKSAFQEKLDDLKLDKYELSKENDDLKKRISCEKEDSKQLKSEIMRLESEKKDLNSQNQELDSTISKHLQEIEEKNKKLAELTQEILNSNNYVQKILKEKENVERDLANLTKNATLDNSQVRNEISVLQAHVSNLDSLNTSLEKSKSQLEQKLKQVLKEKSEIVERQEEMGDEIEGLKQIRSSQSSQIVVLENSIQSLQKDLENDRRQIVEYKNKLATYMCNATAMQKELRSMTPPPRKVIEENKAEESSPTRICHTADSAPKASLEKLLEKLKKTIINPAPPIIINWCKEVLGKENYIIRFPENNSGVSEDSKSNVSDISSVSEVNVQEGNYRAHAKMLEQRKSIQKLQDRLSDKKQRLKVFKDHIKSLQDEIRRLDSELRSEKNLDLEYLKSTIQKFVENLKNLDGESIKILQIIYSLLGIRSESLPRVESKSKWSLFSKKPLNKYV